LPTRRACARFRDHRAGLGEYYSINLLLDIWGLSTQAEDLTLAHSIASPCRHPISAARDPRQGDSDSDTTPPAFCPRDWQSLIDGLRLSRGLCPPGTANGGHRS